MLPFARQFITGWGRTSGAECKVYRPEKQADLPAIFSEHDSTLIAHGNGRSYGDASVNEHGVVLTERQNRFLSLDETKGELTAQAGVTLAEVMQVCVPKGWFLPVVPGTRHATLGGAVACNVHGKNHFRFGTLGAHVLSLSLRTPDGELAVISPSQNPELFWATVGGLGMTGVIEDVTLKLMPIATTLLNTSTRKVESLADMLAAFKKHAATSEYMVGWIDHFGRGNSLGRGVFESAAHAGANETGAGRLEEFRLEQTGVTVPKWFPSLLLNRFTMALYNKRRFGKYNLEETLETKPFSEFFHPLDSISHWNRLYGKKGLLQYQCMVPETPAMDSSLHEILKMIQKAGCFSYLAVIKYHGPDINGSNKAALNFAGPGYSLALDFPNTKRVRKLLDKVDDYVASIGGKVYLPKDARMSAATFDKMYGAQLPAWRSLLKNLDPRGRMHSAMSARLGFRPDVIG